MLLSTVHLLCWNISLREGGDSANFVRFAHCVFGGGGVRKALEKGYLEHPRFACCTEDMFEILVRSGQCLRCLLPRFVNRQLPSLHTNSCNVLLLPPMHHRHLWCAKETALGV